MMVSHVRPWTAGLLGLALLFALSCAGGGGNPMTPPTPGGEAPPDLTPGAGTDETLTPPTGPSGQGQSYTGQGRALWAVYDIVYDEATGEFTVLPLRGAQFTFNMLGFLQPPDGDPANLKVLIINKDDFISQGLMTLEVRITHPLDIPRLVGFDTMGVLIGFGSILFDEDTGVVFAGPDDLRLLNFDGYTRWMNPVEFTDPGFSGFLEGRLGAKGQDWTASVNAYKYFAEGLGPTDYLGTYLEDTDNQELRGAFMPGTTNSRYYDIQFPMPGGSPQVRFQYAILSNFRAAKDASGDPIPDPDIEDFSPEANAQEAVYIDADTSGSTLYYDEDTSDAGGDLIISLTVHDWQGLEALGGAGSFNEIDAVGLGSPDGLFDAGGMLLDATALAGTEVSTPGSTPTTLVLLIEGLTPEKSGPHELLIAVYNADPSVYFNFGYARPEDAKLAGYTRAIVDVGETAVNYPPVIDEIQGPTEVTCWEGVATYTCIAHDPNPGDVLGYIPEVVASGALPLFLSPPSDDNTFSVDWGDFDRYRPGSYEVWFKVTDGQAETKDSLTVQNLPETIKVEDITADDEDTYDVLCTNIDAVYTAHAEHCNPGVEMQYRFLRGFGDPPVKPNPLDPDWTEWSMINAVIYGWGNTEIGPWWIIAGVRDETQEAALSPPYIVTRIDTPPTDLNPPQGATEVDCRNTQEQYQLTGGDDCDGGEIEREWTLTQTSDPPAGGWVDAANDVFYVDWSVYPLGTYYLWQRAGAEPNWTISDPLEVHRINTAPDTPPAPEGPQMVDCAYTEALYQAGVVGDCEDDPLQREWALTTGTEPPDTGWVPFDGTTFYVDYSLYPSGEYMLFQRASDDGVNWQYSPGLPVVKINAPPDEPQVPDGPTGVTCHDDAVEYQAGPAADCDVGDILTRHWGVSFNPDSLPLEWTEFSGETFVVDWSEYFSTILYLSQKVSDGELDSFSDPLAVLKGNSPPEVGPPTGTTDVDCTDVEAEYEETVMSDCDLFTHLTKYWYLSIDPDTPTGGVWIQYEDTSFTIDFSALPSGDYYLFLRASDGEAETTGDPLHIVRHNSAPDKPATPTGPTEVDCTTVPAIYNGGPITDCDKADTLTRYYYLSTDPDTPTGGTWHEALGDQFMVDFTGVIADETYYLFQKASDGQAETISDPLAVFYHNTAPEQPARPAGETDVSCVNDNEEYYGGEVLDCDTWQDLTREWAVNTLNMPPAVGWAGFIGNTWTVDWSEYAEGDYYLFQRVYDGFERSYSTSLAITVGPPQLIPPDTPSGNTDPICDGPVETYDAGEYLVSCLGLDIIREWAVNIVPTPPLAGWTEFTGTTFDVLPLDLGFGNRYLYQRARLDPQEQVSTPLWIVVHPGELGVPPIPSGSTIVDCTSTQEDYDMGEVSVPCPGTPLTRSWQVQTASGDPLMEWQYFTESPVTINWTTFQPEYTYHLLQKADDGEHVQTSDPLVVTYVNDEPEFLGTITGPTSVDCTYTHAVYDGGEVYDCDPNQTLTREWAWNTVDAYPVSGWTEMVGLSFMIDYSSSDFEPGDIYLFQRVSDGKVTVYDPLSLHIVYANTPPEMPFPPMGETMIDCYNWVQIYECGGAFDCDNTPLTREWALNDADAPPETGWLSLVGTSFDMNWEGAAPGLWYLFQRVSDDEYTVNSLSLEVTVVNTPPSIMSFVCLDGDGPFDTDGQTQGLTGLDLVNALDFWFDVEDCDGDFLLNYWAVTTSPMSPEYEDPAWNGPIGGNEFTVDLTAYVSEAPAELYVHLGSYDGFNFTALPWFGTINLWERVWLTTFSDIGDMWAEHACVPGEGSYTWEYDGANGYLRLTDYGESSYSAVWSDPAAFPGAPVGDASGTLLSYLNPALADGIDYGNFNFLDDSSCEEFPLDPFTGNGCSSSSPELKEFILSSTAPFWGNSWRVGLTENGLDGCTSSDFWMDWVGIWIQPG